MINLFEPYVPKEAIEAVTDTLRSRFIGQGPRVDQFEKDFEKLFSVSHAVALNSGSAALDTAYELIGLKEGDEVVSTPLTCTATNLLLLRKGVKIIWADILPDTLCIDFNDVAKKINSKTKAVVQVHLGGIRAEVGSCWFDHTKIPVVSDAAQALGIFSGEYSCCSFQAIKHITTIDGGMIITKSAEDAHKAKLLRWFGIDRAKKIANNWQAYQCRKMTFDIEVPGTKRHMADVNAAMGIVGLKHYEEVIAYRKNLFNIYKQRLSNIPGINYVVDGKDNTYWLCTVVVERRDDFARMLFEADVDTNVVQVRNDIYNIFGGERAELPVMNALEHKYLSLPLGMHVTEDEVNYICDKIEGGW